MKKFLSILALVTSLGLGFTGNTFAEDAVAVEPVATEAVATEVAAEPVADIPATAPAVEVESATTAEAVSVPAPAANKGDTAWMLVATALVTLMTIPGLALFYGGLVRQKNMLSVLMQVFVIFSLLGILWAVYGYSVAFTGGTYFGGLSKAFLAGITTDSLGATFSKGVYKIGRAHV